MEPEVRHIAKTDYSKHRVLRSNGEVTIDGVYPEREAGFYMVRVRVPGGLLTIAQAYALAEFAGSYANGEWHIDTRANVEFHGVAEAKLLAFIEAIETTGLSTRGACGDSVRNIVTGSETASASVARIQRVVETLTRMFAGKPEFETLPRKFKIAFYAADDREPLHRINDLGFVEAKRVRHNSGELPPELSQTRFSVWIGGGLGREPRLGDLLFRQVPEHAVPGLVAAAVLVHNEHSNRKNRVRARLKFVLEDLGLTRVRNLILEKWVPPPEVDTAPRLTLEAPPVRISADGIHVQDDGRFRVRVPVVAGDLSVEQAAAITRAAERSGAATLVLSARQNLSIPDVEAAQVPGLVRELEALGYPPSGWFGARDIVACPGASSCRKGFVETHDFARELADALENVEAPSWAKRLRISVSGCPNSCSQPQLYDIGFRGNAGKANGQVVKGYDLLLGGRLYGRTLLAQQFANLLSQRDVLAAATAAVRVYTQQALEAEPFEQFIERVGLHAFARALRGQVKLEQGEWAATLPEVAVPADGAQAEAASAALETRSPREILQWALETYGDSLLVTSALGAGGVLLAQYLKELAPGHPTFLINTGKLFPESLAYYRQLREQFGLKLLAVGSGFGEQEFAEIYGERLWERDPDLCCNIRKVQVLGRLRQGKRAWVSGLRREQGGERANGNVLELLPDGLLKVQPLAFVSRKWIDEELRNYGLPQHPLHGMGYRSVGCEPCTRAVKDGEQERAGRWAGLAKTECGLHQRRQEAQS
ncbi:MAG: phosphoadenylyl-sulfate reductase [Planctomycetes bacterium]|nr:phosphoadenylyl-sulfate reductase [Planctomycetota bacterium]MCB9935869.1 phosphoadenylyl-sulfate reductase [Planctomycetota bacterium]